MKSIRVLLCTVVIILVSIANSHAAKIAVVSNSGGGNYSDPVAAMSDLATWCGTPSATNTCLLKIDPGFYDIGSLSLQMQEFVDIEGSGENTTKISGTLDSNTGGVIIGASNAELRFLTVENRGGVSVAVAIYNKNVSPKLTNITALTSGASTQYGVLNSNSSPLMTNVTVSASGGDFLEGVSNISSSSPTMKNINVYVSGVNAVGYAIFNASSSAPTLIGVQATATTGIRNQAITNNGAYPLLINVVATASGGEVNYGVVNASNSIVKINHSVISGTTNSVWATSQPGATYIGNTQLGSTVSGPLITCAGVYDSNYTFYANTCP